MTKGLVDCLDALRRPRRVGRRQWRWRVSGRRRWRRWRLAWWRRQARRRRGWTWRRWRRGWSVHGRRRGGGGRPRGQWRWRWGRVNGPLHPPSAGKAHLEAGIGVGDGRPGQLQPRVELLDYPRRRLVGARKHLVTVGALRWRGDERVCTVVERCTYAADRERIAAVEGLRLCVVGAYQFLQKRVLAARVQESWIGWRKRRRWRFARRGGRRRGLIIYLVHR